MKLRNLCKRTIAIALTLCTFLSLLPTSVLAANAEAAAAEKEAIRRTLLESVSAEEYPQGLFDFLTPRMETSEDVGEAEFAIVRRGNTDEAASVTFKIIDMTAEYGKDYVIKVPGLLFDKELEGNPNSQSLYSEGVYRIGDDTESVDSENHDADETVPATDTEQELADENEDSTEYYELNPVEDGTDLQSARTALTGETSDDTNWRDADEAEIAVLTEGAYDPTVGSLTNLWNVTGGGPVPSRGDIREAMKHIGINNLSVDGTTIEKKDPLTRIDLGGVGKGYTLQALLTYLSSTDIPYGIVSMGGNIGVFGSKGNETPYKIGIKDPRNTDGIVGYLYAGGGFVSVSGDYERYFEEGGERYHHIINPATGYPADNGLTSVVCYTQNGASADALSTALFVMGLDKAMEFYAEGSISFEAIFITEDYEIHMTDGIREMELFELTASKYTLAE